LLQVTVEPLYKGSEESIGHRRPIAPGSAPPETAASQKEEATIARLNVFRNPISIAVENDNFRISISRN
jgi:hypothetical protein